MDIHLWEVADRSSEVETAITLVDLKAWMRVNHAHEDTLIESLREASFGYAEEYCRVFLALTTATRNYSSFNGDCIILDGYNIKDIILLDGDATPIPYTLKLTDSKAILTLETSLIDSEISVTFTSGFETFPASLTLTLKIIANTMYSQREDSVFKLPTFVSSKLNPYKLFKVK